jgi:hypothetical protein
MVEEWALTAAVLEPTAIHKMAAVSALTAVVWEQIEKS